MDINPSEENIFDHLNRAMRDSRASLKILEEQIDISLQMEYFKLSEAIRSNPSDYESINLENDPDFDQLAEQAEPYKTFLIQLAHSGDPRSFKWIETECQNREGELRGWSILALQETRMVLESELLNESQVFISTGLGGKANRLRYFVAMISADNQPFTELQKRILEKESSYIFKDQDDELEEIRLEEQYVFITGLLSMETNLKAFFQELITNCNIYGDFLSPNFLLTNLKILTNEEVRQHFEKK